MVPSIVLFVLYKSARWRLTGANHGLREVKVVACGRLYWPGVHVPDARFTTGTTRYSSGGRDPPTRSRANVQQHTSMLSKWGFWVCNWACKRIMLVHRYRRTVLARRWPWLCALCLAVCACAYRARAVVAIARHTPTPWVLSLVHSKVPEGPLELVITVNVNPSLRSCLRVYPVHLCPRICAPIIRGHLAPNNSAIERRNERRAARCPFRSGLCVYSVHTRPCVRPCDVRIGGIAGIGEVGGDWRCCGDPPVRG